MIRVVNVTGRGIYSDPELWYVGRPSVLGNPFRIGVHGTREEVILKYRDWLLNTRDPAVIAELDRLYRLYKERGRITLGCWCAPKPCHANVIAEYLMMRRRRDGW